MRPTKRRFWLALAAILTGNAIYLILEPFLPVRARHVPFRLDWGLFADFWLCVAVFYVLSLFFRPKT